MLERWKLLSPTNQVRLVVGFLAPILLLVITKLFLDQQTESGSKIVVNNFYGDFIQEEYVKRLKQQEKEANARVEKIESKTAQDTAAGDEYIEALDHEAREEYREALENHIKDLEKRSSHLERTGEVEGTIFANGMINELSDMDVDVSEVRDGTGGKITTLNLLSGGFLRKLDVLDGSRAYGLPGSRIGELRAFDMSVSELQAGATISSINTFGASIVTNRSNNQEVPGDTILISPSLLSGQLSIVSPEHAPQNTRTQNTRRTRTKG